MLAHVFSMKIWIFCYLSLAGLLHRGRDILSQAYIWANQCCGSGMFYPRSRIGIRNYLIPDPNIFSSYLNPDPTGIWKVECKLRFFLLLMFQEQSLSLSQKSRISDPGCKKELVPGSGSATLGPTNFSSSGLGLSNNEEFYVYFKTINFLCDKIHLVIFF
jgi:hypothetical protein